ncbi:DUF3307 domain-containing protein [Tenacibaculum sp. HL-MS23]|nr:DUF3307 domain-containing protein [Tenacibaculum sp. HL-MS23]WNW02252.1 DUF3307 domain-containing protein [Tenacibaculum sp. HL-MS23]
MLLIMVSFSLKYILGILFITTTHYLIDLSKLYLQHKKNKTWLFFIDQFLHILMLALVTYWYFPYRFNIDFLFFSKSTFTDILFDFCEFCCIYNYTNDNIAMES